ncbi:MAG: hypothetical protein EWV85_06155 [Microcystis aeruginosa Ma_QC_C_20070703_M131]|uniref:Uncharacterized protein n=1 Tax=Microcystis aeruginosa Ma_QC_C_20070703_M131 TaxID=2486263 RepID=A0A551YAU9_MICAE|nr:MAG: hypothetical protein EWV85_06155 [Microcystis aeruginosa Ma_QC_C_20070703_M131]
MLLYKDRLKTFARGLVYREALRVGRQEGELAAKLAFIPRLLVLELKVEQIAQALELDLAE